VSEWPTVALRHIARLEYGDALPGDARIDGDVPVVGSGGTDSTHNHANSGPGPAIVVGRKGSAGSVRWFDEPVHVIDTAYWVRTGSRIDSRFLYYVLSVQRWSETTQDVGVPGLSRDLAHATKVLLPPLDEQRRIADFLDTETARLDRLLVAVQRQGHVAAERLQAIVERHTWLDVDTPATPLRRSIAEIKTGSTPPTAGRDYSRSQGIGWLSPGSIGERLTIGEPARILDPAALSDGVVPRFAADSVVIVGIGATAGRVGHLRAIATGNQQLTAIATGPTLSARFLAWQMWSRTSELRALAPYTTLPIIGNDYLKSVLVRVPSLERQHEIVTDMDATAGRTELLSYQRERAVLLLNERRQALITAAVTGQLDVTTARGVRS